MPGLIVFLHGLGGDPKDWGTVPQLVVRSLGPEFEVTTPKYNASRLSGPGIDLIGQHILSLIQTNYPNHDPIFLVGYSLGGLVAREVCRSLLMQGPDPILIKIRSAITFGTPLEGARIINRFLKFFPVTKKLRQLANAKAAFDSYEKAILLAEERKVRRPKLLHVQMIEDKVIARHVQGDFTSDDEAADVISGGHRHFGEHPDHASFIADLLLRHIRNGINSASKPDLKPPTPVGEPDLPDRLILIACSHGKRPDGETPFQGPAPAKWLPQSGLRSRVIARRSYIFSLLKDAKISDGFERGGNRAYQPANQNLKHGPDLGGISVSGDEGSYRRASDRYNGRIYLPITAAAWAAALNKKNEYRVLIMSGLYGLIEPDECIQNYDVHLTDTNDSGISVSSMWAELFTSSIETYVKHSFRNRKVNIFNLLCDHHYVDAIQWHALPKECSVFHLSSPTLADVDLLPPAGVVLNDFLLHPEKMDGIDRDNTVYQLSDFGAPPPGLAGVEVRFESRIGLSKKA